MKKYIINKLCFYLGISTPDEKQNCIEPIKRFKTTQPDKRLSFNELFKTILTQQ